MSLSPILLQAARKDLLEALCFLNALHTQWRVVTDADGQKLPPSEFQNLEIGENLQLGQEYMLWQKFRVGDKPSPPLSPNPPQCPRTFFERDTLVAADLVSF